MWRHEDDGLVGRTRVSTGARVGRIELGGRAYPRVGHGGRVEGKVCKGCRSRMDRKEGRRVDK